MDMSLGLHLDELITVYPKLIPTSIGSLQDSIQKYDLEFKNKESDERGQIRQMEDILYRLLWCHLKSMGLFSEKNVLLADIKAKTGLIDLYGRWLEESIAIFERNGYISRQEDLISDLEKVTADIDSVWDEWNKKKVGWLENPNMKSHVMLVDAALARLPDILTGKLPATDVMFPNSSMELVQGVYKSNRISEFFNEVLANTLIAYIKERVKQDPSVKICIIEMGAGTGGTSAMLFQKLKSFHQHMEEYCYTDLSKAFLLHAEKEFGGENPYLTYKIFNVEVPADVQGIDVGRYDIAIAANVLHATKNIRMTLRNAKATLKNNGVLLLNEINNNSVFAHLTFGLLEGWWLYEDQALRIPGCPGLFPHAWEEVMKAEGFSSIYFPVPEAHELGQQIIIAESDGVVRKKRVRKMETPRVTSPKRVMATMKQPPRQKTAKLKAGEVTEQLLVEKSAAYFKKLVGETLHIPISKIEASKSLEQYGIDSIVVVQLTNSLREVFEDVSSTLFFEYSTIDELVGYFVKTHKDSLMKLIGLSEAEAASTEFETEEVAEEPFREGDAPTETATVHSQLSMRKAGRFSEFQDSQPASQIHTGAGYDIAIIGVSGRFPQAENVHQFWNNLMEGRDCITDIPEDRWNQEFYSGWDSNGKPLCMWGGFIDGVDCFDPLFFNISCREAEIMDPQDRLFLECVWNLFESAGYTRERLQSMYQGKVGVYAGAMYQQYHLYSADIISECAMALSSYSSIANRVSYFFNFQGPSIAVDTACSSSTIAIGLACESLLREDCKVAVAGGVNLSINPKKYAGLNLTQMLASSRDSRSFGNGDGFIPAECVGAVLLKPLSEAIKDNDSILAVIKSSATNHGGHSTGYTVPNLNSQAQLVEDNFKKSGIDPRTISYIEAAANGSALGDPIEVNALIKAFNKFTSNKNFCAMGSVKSNMGHAEAASGISQITKVVLQMQHKKLVPTIKAEPINPNLNIKNSPFFLQQELRDWKRPLVLIDGEEREFPRRATVSSFGAGGSNAHLIIEEYIADSEEIPCIETDDVPQIIIFSAKNKKQLQAVVRQMLEFIEENKDIPLTRFTYTLQLGREAMQLRVALVVNTIEELILGMKEYLDSDGDIESDSCSMPIYTGNLEDDHSDIRKLISGKVGEAVLQALMEENNNEKIALHWTHGGNIQWEAFYRGRDIRFISLPTYPFEMRRCWIGAQGAQFMKADPKRALAEKQPAFEISTGVKDYVAELTAKILGMEPGEVNPKTSLFEYGFDSIMAIQLLQQLQAQIDPAFDMNKLIQCDTVEKITKHLNPKNTIKLEVTPQQTVLPVLNAWPQFPELIRLNQSAGGRPIFWFHGGIGGVGAYKSIAQISQRPFWGIQARGFMTERCPLHGIQAIVAYYVHIIQTVQPEGSYDLGGYSLGGVVAYEAARQLQELGQTVNSLVMLDAPCGYNNFKVEDNTTYRTHTKTLILQAVNMTLLSSLRQQPKSIEGILVHRDEVDLTLDDDEFAKQVIAIAKTRGLNKSEKYLNTLIQSNIKLQPTFQRERYVVYPLRRPEGVNAYYFRNKSGIFMGEFEPYFVADIEAPNFDHRNYWGEWSKFLKNSQVIDVEAPNHMMLLSEPKSFEAIGNLCKKLYCST